MRVLSGIWSGIAVIVFLLIVIGGSITLTAITSTSVSLPEMVVGFVEILAHLLLYFFFR